MIFTIKHIGILVGAAITGLMTSAVPAEAALIGDSVDVDIFNDRNNNQLVDFNYVVDGQRQRFNSPNDRRFVAFNLTDKSLLLAIGVRPRQNPGPTFGFPKLRWEFSDLDWVNAPGKITGVKARNPFTKINTGSIDFTDDSITITTLGFPPIIPEKKSPVIFRYDIQAEHVPTPALLPGLIGMGVAAFKKRKQQEV